jgi:hypothetical protein
MNHATRRILFDALHPMWWGLGLAFYWGASALRTSLTHSLSWDFTLVAALYVSMVLWLHVGAMCVMWAEWQQLR